MGAISLGTSVCGELFKITILDNDSPGVQLGKVPPEDSGLLDSYVPSPGAGPTGCCPPRHPTTHALPSLLA